MVLHTRPADVRSTEQRPRPGPSSSSAATDHLRPRRPREAAPSVRPPTVVDDLEIVDPDGNEVATGPPARFRLKGPIITPETTGASRRTTAGDHPGRSAAHGATWATVDAGRLPAHHRPGQDAAHPGGEKHPLRRDRAAPRAAPCRRRRRRDRRRPPSSEVRPSSGGAWRLPTGSRRGGWARPLATFSPVELTEDKLPCNASGKLLLKKRAAL